jgi:hypothetical protein
MAIHELLKTRLSPERPMTSITLRIAVDVVESMKRIAPQKGFSGYQSLMKSYIGSGLRKDEAEYIFSKHARVMDALRKRGVDEKILEQAERDAA